MSFIPAACTSCGQPLRPNAQFCDACGASARLAVRPVEVVRPVAPPSVRSSPVPILAAITALVVLVAGIVVWRTRERAPEPAPVAQRTERPPGMSSKPSEPEPADIGTSDGPEDIGDETGRDETVDVPPDEPAPPPPPPRVQALPPPPPVAREIVVAPPPPPSPGKVSGPPMLPPDLRDPPRPAPPPDVDDGPLDGPLWDAYASARANAESPGTKDPAAMRAEFCAAAARTLRDGQGRDVGRIRSDQRRFGC